MRPGIPLTSLKGVGEKTAKLFGKLGIGDTEALLRYYPVTYEMYQPVQTVASLQPERIAAVRCTVRTDAALRRAGRLTILSFEAGDATGTLGFTYFNMPYLKNSMTTGKTRIFRGMVRLKRNRLVMEQAKTFTDEEYAALSGELQPRYALTKGLSNAMIVKCMRAALGETPYLAETLPEEILKNEGFPDIGKALRQIHFPMDVEAYRQARRRLAFEEFYTFIRNLRALKSEQEAVPNAYPCIEAAGCARLIERLPYRLTDAQAAAWEEIQSDLTGPHVMNRLVQGDVGSGKTILAFLAILLCVCNGYQGAIMAPTAVLARQHFDTFSALAKEYDLPLRPVLLTGALSAKDRREALKSIADGTANCIVGTHALFQEKVAYHRLALVVTDEQHRFGVRQRDRLAEKGGDVHVLAMSATPIPRTLAIILYGDLHVSQLAQMPTERKRIKNAVVDPGYRETAYKFIVKEVHAGRQAYIICPMIEPGEMEGVENVTEYAGRLAALLPGQIRTGVLHGRMKAQDKDRVMEEFATGNIDILVSTTVVEVGVNVPNATVIMIEDAQRFGLAQLHQLRGRVGRGEAQSYCIFVDTSPDGVSDRLEILKTSNDGFAIAEEDLKQRGPGDLFGIRQSGDLQFRIGDIYRDADLITLAARYAERG